MKLLELSPVKSVRGKSPTEMAQAVKTNHESGKSTLKILGKGANGLALTNGKYVFKFWQNDSAYEDYVKFAMANPSPWYPKFISRIRVLPKFVQAKDKSLVDVKYVKMELLEPLVRNSGLIPWFTDEALVSKMPLNADEDNGNHLLYRDVFSACYEASSVQDAIQEQFQTHLAEFGVPLEKFFKKNKKHMNPAIHEVFEAVFPIAAMAKKAGHEFDYGNENMAMRGDQPVILDPVSNYDDMKNLYKRFGYDWGNFVI